MVVNRSLRLVALSWAVVSLSGAGAYADENVCRDAYQTTPKDAWRKISELARAVQAPEAVAVDLDRALEGDAAMKASRLGYCGHNSNPPHHDATPECAGARAVIGADGSVQWHPDGGPRTWCLRADTGWGKRQLVAIRRQRQPDSEATCFDAKPEQRYTVDVGGDEQDGAVVKIWAARSKGQIKDDRANALKEAKKTLDAALRVFILRQWADQLHAAAQTIARTEQAKLVETYRRAVDITVTRAKICSAATAELNCTIPDNDLAQTLKAVVEDEAPALELHEPAGDVTSTEMEKALCYGALSLSQTPLPPDDELFAVARTLVVYAQDPGQQRLPFPVFVGEFPLANTLPVIEVTPNDGHKKIEGRFVGKERLAIFAHGLHRGKDKDHPSDVAVFFKGKQIEQQVNDFTAAFLMFVKTFLPGNLLKPASSWASHDPQFCVGASDVKACSQLEADCPQTNEDQRRACIVTKGPHLGVLGSLKDPDSLVELVDQLNLLIGNLQNPQILPPEREVLKPMIEKRTVQLLATPLPSVGGDPSAPYFSRLIFSDELDDGYEYEAQICHDIAQCNAKTDDDKVSAVRVLKVPQRHLWAGTATELSWGYGWGGPLGGYGFDQISGPAGPQTFYRLRAHENARDEIAFTQLLTFYPGALPSCRSQRCQRLQRLLFAAGPTLTTANCGAALRQWNLRAGIEVLPALLLLVGASAREIDTPTGAWSVNEIVGVNAGGAAPVLETRDHWVWQLSLGIGVDLATLGKLIAGGSGSQQAPASGSGDKAKGGS